MSNQIEMINILSKYCILSISMYLTQIYCCSIQNSNILSNDNKKRIPCHNYCKECFNKLIKYIYLVVKKHKQTFIRVCGQYLTFDIRKYKPFSLVFVFISVFCSSDFVIYLLSVVNISVNIFDGHSLLLSLLFFYLF